MTAARPQVDVERLLADEQARDAGPKKLPPLGALAREFERIDEDRYRLGIPDVGVIIEIDRLRREKHELWGELSVSCALPGARTVNGDVLSIADLNLSAARSRQERAKQLEARSNTRGGLDWTGLIEEFCQRVLQADRAGSPAVDLRQLARPTADADMVQVDGLALVSSLPPVFTTLSASTGVNFPRSVP